MYCCAIVKLLSFKSVFYALCGIFLFELVHWQPSQSSEAHFLKQVNCVSCAPTFYGVWFLFLFSYHGSTNICQHVIVLFFWPFPVNLNVTINLLRISHRNKSRNFFIYFGIALENVLQRKKIQYRITNLQF